MIQTIQKISSFFFLSLLGVYCLNKIFLFRGTSFYLFTWIDHALLLPLGFITGVYIFASMKKELDTKNIGSLIWDISLPLFFLIFLFLFLFYAFIF